MTDDGLCLVESNPTPPRPTIHPTLFDVEGMIGRRWNSKGKVKSMPGFDRRSKRAGPFPSTPQFSSLRHSHSAKTDRPSDIVRSRRIDGDIRRFVYRAASREGGTRTRGGEGGRGCVAPRRCARTMTMGSWSDSDSPVGPPIPIRAVKRNCGNDPPPPVAILLVAVVVLHQDRTIPPTSQTTRWRAMGQH